MGRGDRGESTAQLAPTRRQASGNSDEKLLKRYEWFIRGWEVRMHRALDGSQQTLVEQTAAKAKALRPLTYNDTDQKLLIKAVQDCAAMIETLEDNGGPRNEAEQRRLEMARRLDAKAREIFILCHTGFVEQHISRYTGQFDADSGEGALERLRGAAWIGLSTAMDRYDFNRPAKPLTYAANWIRAEIAHLTEHEGRSIRLKSKANHLAKRVESQAKRIENEGRQVTIAELADRLKESPERIADVMPFARRSMVRLDAPVSSDGAETSVGALIIDDEQRVVEPILEADAAERVREAVATIPAPLQRRVLELYYGLAENEVVEQKDLFDGVYRDSRGRAYSAEASVIHDRKARGEKITKKSQRELNEKFKNGKLIFEPGTPEAHELSRAALGEIDRAARFEKAITRETGVPPTSGTIQEAKRQGEEFLRKSPLLSGLAPTYRGVNELENSETAREQVRQALLRIGAIDEAKVERLKSTRSASGGKSELRILAEKHGLVDPESGRREMSRLDSIAAQ